MGLGAQAGLACAIGGVLVGVVIALAVGNKVYSKRKEKQQTGELTRQ